MLNLETLVRIIVKEVLKEIVRQGGDINTISLPVYEMNQSVTVIDMNMYSTPVLTEKKMLEIRTDIVEVPKGTVLTPGAREIIKKKKITINYITK